MAIDHALFDLAESTGHTWWRAYRWDPWCLSFGRHEPASRRYDRRLIAERGIDCVRRPTGGRAVWHARELTYAVAGPTSQLGQLKEAYRRIHEILARAIGTLGVSIGLAASRQTPGLGAGPCFAVPVGGELLVAGRKVLGSAQMRGPTALLQHGSLLLEDDQSLVRTVLLGGPGPASGPDPALAPETTLSTALGHPVAFQAAAEALGSELTSHGVESVAGEPNEVLRRARTHYDTYRSVALTWGR
ncbi:MAG: hypothetical protein FJ206_14525 [Gemmatimonadetes bacterium]|nr:hypothetical protein [Gemmatimonadota bacterium]